MTEENSLLGSVEQTPTTPTEDVNVTTQAQEEPVEEPSLLGEKVEEAKETQPEDSKTEEGKKEEVSEEIPEKYEIKVPEGLKLDEAAMEKFTPIFKELGLSNAEAQKLADAYAPHISSIVEKAIADKQQEVLEFYEKETQSWKEQTLKELGTDSKEKLAICAKARTKFGDADLLKALDDTKLGNHPAMVRFFYKVGKLISEDSFVESEKKKGSDGYEVLYPSMSKT